MKRGDIVLVRYPFSDFSNEKLRPALILLPQDEEGDFLLAFITTTIKKGKFDILLQKGKQTGLHQDSTLRLNKLMSVHRSLIIGKIGQLPEDNIVLVNNILRGMLEL